MSTWNDAFYLTDLKSAGRSGELRQFEVRVQVISEPNNKMGLDCLIRPSPAVDVGDALYFASFSEVGDRLLQLQALRNDLPDKYHGYGLTRNLIPIIASRYEMRIRSSTTRDSSEEMRTPATTASWDHMVRDGLARYDVSEDRYYYPVENASASDA